MLLWGPSVLTFACVLCRMAGHRGDYMDQLADVLMVYEQGIMPPEDAVSDVSTSEGSVGDAADEGDEGDEGDDGPWEPTFCPHQDHCHGCQVLHWGSPFLSQDELQFHGCCGQPECKAWRADDAEDPLGELIQDSIVKGDTNPARRYWVYRAWVRVSEKHGMQTPIIIGDRLVYSGCVLRKIRSVLPSRRYQGFLERPESENEDDGSQD